VRQARTSPGLQCLELCYGWPVLRVLHFAGIINRYDFIDTILSRIDRTRFSVAALAGEPPRLTAPYPPEERYPLRIVGRQFSTGNLPFMFRELLREMRAFRPDIVHAHHYLEAAVAAVAVRIGRATPLVIGRHYSDFIHVMTHGAKRKVLLGLEAFANRTATRILVPTAEVARLLITRQGVPAGKVAAIPYALHPGKCVPSAPVAAVRIRRDNGLEGKKVAVTCGRLNPEKGTSDLLKAVPLVLARYPEFRLLIVGSGPEEEGLRSLARELRVDEAARFVGWRSDAVDWIAASDVLVQPSLSESFCQTLVEAMALSRPVVMTPVGFAPEAIGKDERGRLVPARNPAALADAISDLFSDPERMTRMGSDARRFVHETLAPAPIVRRHEEIYLECGSLTGRAHCPE
jgi:glycosyltransferase involved in cell wall biosynthesis